MRRGREGEVEWSERREMRWGEERKGGKGE